MLYLLSHHLVGGVNIEFVHLSVSIVESSELRLPKISRLHMGDYLCVASNGIAPSTSKKFRIRVQCESGLCKELGFNWRILLGLGPEPIIFLVSSY